MSLLFDVAAVAGGFLVWRYLRARARLRAKREQTETESASTASADAFVPFHCKLGDVVVLRRGSEEAWLAGALVFAEQRPVAALFVAPDAREDRALYVRGGDSEVGWLTPFRTLQVAGGHDPPRALDCQGVRFDRKRRLPVRVERHGTGTPPMGATAILAEYAGPGAERVLIVAGADAALAWRGVALAEADYDVLPSGQATLQ